jgi:hypothetical protein
MIVRPSPIVHGGPDHLLLIRQPDHAELAGRIMEAWRADKFAERPTRAKALRATSQHDTGWITGLEGGDDLPRVNPDTGAPYGFVDAPLSVRQGVWPRAIGKLAAEDPYVAALVAQHALTVYRRFSGDPDWQPFFKDMELRRDDLIAPDTLFTFLQDYTIVGLGDLFSLIFCAGWREPYLMESYQAILHGDCLRIAPDPFEGATVPLEIEARRIPARAYASDADLRATLTEAPIVRLSGTATGAPLPSIS